MTETVLKSRIINKHDIEANWNKAVNFIPKKGEFIVYDIEQDENGNILDLPEGRTTPYLYQRFKLGDGIHTAAELPFSNDEVIAKLEEMRQSVGYDFIATNEDEFAEISNYSGRILVKGDFEFTESVGINLQPFTHLVFEGTFCIHGGAVIYIDADDNTASVEGGVFYTLTDDDSAPAYLDINSIGSATNIRTALPVTDLSIEFNGVENISHCDFAVLNNCWHIDNCAMATTSTDIIESISACKYISHIASKDEFVDYTGSVSNIFYNCSYISNVSDFLGIWNGERSNSYIDYDTCPGAINHSTNGYDHVITNEDEFATIGDLSGKILIKGDFTFDYDIGIDMRANTELYFDGTFLIEDGITVTIDQADNGYGTKVSGGYFKSTIDVDDTSFANAQLNIMGVEEVSNVKIAVAPNGYPFDLHLYIEGPSKVVNCDFSQIYDCSPVTGCYFVAPLYLDLPDLADRISDCQYLNNISSKYNQLDLWDTDANILSSCSYVSHIDGGLGLWGQDGTCHSVDVLTCPGYAGANIINDKADIAYVDSKSLETIQSLKYDDDNYFMPTQQIIDGIIYTANTATADYICSGYTEDLNPNATIVDRVRRYPVRTVGWAAFQNCTGLETINIPDTITRLDNYAFSNCTELKTVTIGSGVTSIGARAFAYCSNLQRINYNGTRAEWYDIPKGTAWSNGAGAYTLAGTDGYELPKQEF